MNVRFIKKIILSAVIVSLVINFPAHADWSWSNKSSWSMIVQLPFAWTKEKIINLIWPKNNSVKPLQSQHTSQAQPIQPVDQPINSPVSSSAEVTENNCKQEEIEKEKQENPNTTSEGSLVSNPNPMIHPVLMGGLPNPQPHLMGPINGEFINITEHRKLALYLALIAPEQKEVTLKSYNPEKDCYEDVRFQRDSSMLCGFKVNDDDMQKLVQMPSLIENIIREKKKQPSITPYQQNNTSRSMTHGSMGGMANPTPQFKICYNGNLLEIADASQLDQYLSLMKPNDTIEAEIYDPKGNVYRKTTLRKNSRKAVGFDIDIHGDNSFSPDLLRILNQEKIIIPITGHKALNEIITPFLTQTINSKELNNTIAQYLLSHTISDIDKPVKIKGKNKSLLSLAIAHNWARLLDAPNRELITKLDKNSLTIRLLPATIVKCLLALGADIKAQNMISGSLIAQATQANEPAICTILKDNGSVDEETASNSVKEQQPNKKSNPHVQRAIKESKRDK